MSGSSGSERSPLEVARQLDAWGFNVLPAKRGGNHPQVEWKPYQTQRTTGKLEAWFGGASARDYWIATGAISRIVVLDCDNAEAEAYWREILGSELLDSTVAAKTKRGMHYYFRLAEGESWPSWSVHPDPDGDGSGVSYDVRGDLTGVICPPSVNKEWVRSPEEWGPEPVPEALRKPTGGAGEGLSGGGGGGVRSMLTQLLQDPGRGGYNNWFAAVCGHYAKQYRTQRDAYEFHCWQAYAMLPGEPHPKKDATKTLEQIWKTEQAKDEAAQPSAENGYLLGSGPVLLTPTRKKVTEGEKTSYVYDVEEWADFNLVALGVVEDEDANRTYDVEVHRKRQGDMRRALLPASKLADTRGLALWLAEFGVSILPPDGMYPRAGSASTKLTRYLESQNPPHFAVVDHLGWHGAPGEPEAGFVVHEGVIRADGLHPFEKHKPHPRLKNWAPYRYGFAPEEQARGVLNEVLTFHDETVCSVFGAWWAACILKPQIHEVSSQFPFMALEAPSESGKTTGFFSLMLQLAGNTQGNVNPTRAALRDYISAHQSGIVWIDDLDDTAHLMELLRQATGEGSVSKKGEDRMTQEAVQLVAPISISGEALQLSGQKALADRAIQLSVPSPTQRKSLRNPQLAQWSDIVALKRKHPDLSAFAGTLVQMALRQQDLVTALPSLSSDVGGRFGDKIGVLRLGAGILAALTGDDSHIDRVEAWCSEQIDTGSENSLTLKVIPEALVQLAWPKRALSGMGRWPTTPVLVVDDLVWFSPQLLAQWWSEYRGGKVETRTESRQAFEQQARALGLGGQRDEARRRFNIDGDGNKKIWYWRVPEELSELLLQRSRGETGADGGLSRGIHPESMRASLQLDLPAWTHPDGEWHADDSPKDSH